MAIGAPKWHDSAMPRFVLHYHDCPRSFGRPSHWDLMLERDARLATWSFETLPEDWRRKLGVSAPASCDAITVEKLPDHRLAYLDYEGPVSGDRGTVARCDVGEYEPVEETATIVHVRLHGAKLAGQLQLRQLSPKQWQASFTADD